MSEQYFLKPTIDIITYAVKVSSRGNASTVPRLRRSGGSVINLPASAPAQNGSIPTINLGESLTLIGSVLVFDTAILLDGIPQNELDNVFEELRIRFTLNGGLDGPQVYDLSSKEKMQFMDKKLIVASKVIKLVSQ